MAPDPTQPQRTRQKGSNGRKGFNRIKGKARETRNAVVWTLREQGIPLRAISEQTGVPLPTVWRILKSDPVRNESIETRLRAEQATQFESMAKKGQEAALLWLDHAIAAGVLKPGEIPKATLEHLTVLPRVIHAVSQAAHNATKTAALLTGRATERVESTTVDLSKDPDALIDQAIELGMVDHLPPALRAAAQARVAAKSVRERTGEPQWVTD